MSKTIQDKKEIRLDQTVVWGSNGWMQDLDEEFENSMDDLTRTVIHNPKTNLTRTVIHNPTIDLNRTVVAGSSGWVQGEAIHPYTQKPEMRLDQTVVGVANGWQQGGMVYEDRWQKRVSKTAQKGSLLFR